MLIIIIINVITITIIFITFIIMSLLILSSFSSSLSPSSSSTSVLRASGTTIPKFVSSCTTPWYVIQIWFVILLPQQEVVGMLFAILEIEPCLSGIKIKQFNQIHPIMMNSLWDVSYFFIQYFIFKNNLSSFGPPKPPAPTITPPNSLPDLPYPPPCCVNNELSQNFWNYISIYAGYSSKCVYKKYTVMTLTAWCCCTTTIMSTCLLPR